MTITDRQEWLKERQKGIGGSDAAAIIGCNPYKTNVELWEEKTGLRQPEDISDKPYVKYGTEAEQHLRELFALDYPEYDVYYKDFDMRYHPEHEFISATLDGELTEKETGRKGVLEVKTTNILQSQQREKWSDRIPDNYYVQVLHQLLATGHDFAVLKAQLKSLWGKDVRLTTRHYFIEREDVKVDIEYLLSEEIRFWECVKTGTKPHLKLPQI